MKTTIILMGMLAALPLAAQTAAGDTSRIVPVKADSTLLTMTVRGDTMNEIVLDDIEIIGKVDKPGVIIVPKRLEPEIEDAELERSFRQEVKEGVGEIPKPTEELQKVDPLKSIKKTVVRKRKQ